MLPRARVSLLWRTQITLLSVSGSSVASGAITSVSISGSTPSPCDSCSMLLTNSSAPPISMPMLTRTCATIWKLFGGSFFVVSKYKLPGSSAPPSCRPWTIVFQVTAAYVATSSAAPARVDERGDTAHRHGQSGKQERRPDDGADRDRARLLALGDDRDDRDQGLWHRGGHGRQHAAHGAVAEAEAQAGPLDGVGEHRRAGYHHGEA